MRYFFRRFKCHQTHMGRWGKSDAHERGESSADLRDASNNGGKAPRALKSLVCDANGVTENGAYN